MVQDKRHMVTMAMAQPLDKDVGYAHCAECEYPIVITDKPFTVKLINRATPDERKNSPTIRCPHCGRDNVIVKEK